MFASREHGVKALFDVDLGPTDWQIQSSDLRPLIADLQVGSSIVMMWLNTIISARDIGCLHCAQTDPDRPHAHEKIRVELQGRHLFRRSDL